jgi:hypothetical protein
MQSGLWIKLVLLWRGEQRLFWFHPETHIRTIDLGIGAGPPAPHLIDNVDAIASGKKVVRPTGPPIGRAHEIGASLTGAMDHDDWIGMRHVLGRQVLNIHLPGHEPLAAALDILTADEEVAVLGERKGRDVRLAPFGYLRSRLTVRRLHQARRPQTPKMLFHSEFPRFPPYLRGQLPQRRQAE